MLGSTNCDAAVSLKAKTSRLNIAHMRNTSILFRNMRLSWSRRGSMSSQLLVTKQFASVQQATKTIPIVGFVGDMLGSGLVTSLARPDGNTTGVSILVYEADGKRQDILIEAVPGLRLMAVLADVNYTSAAKLDELEKTARAHGIEFSISSCRQSRGDRGSYGWCAGIWCRSAKPCVVTALLCSSAPHYGARRRGPPADDL